MIDTGAIRGCRHLFDSAVAFLYITNISDPTALMRAHATEFQDQFLSIR
jgi:hypothetical protein